MKYMVTILFGLFLVLTTVQNSAAHFGMLIPSDTMVMQNDRRDIHLQISFSHPFDQVGMPMLKPEAFGVLRAGQTTDLRNSLQPVKIMGQAGWRSVYTIKRPGAYLFYFKPQPYWEPAEDCFIIHCTKTVVAAFGDDEGWKAEIGLPAEIVPLVRPFGLYAGNLFRGIVKQNGRPIPFATVEVEFNNIGRKIEAPTAYMTAQTITADKNGKFVYAVPGPGWWGFAALMEADDTLKHDGQDKPVELGAVLWIKFHPWRYREQAINNK